MVDDGMVDGAYGLVPERAAAGVFRDLLIARGISVTGGASAGATPPDPGFTTLGLIESRPLEDVLVEMLHTSDNNTAELMVKEIGVQVSGQGTRQAGLDAIRATLDRWGLPTGALSLADGSGLSRNDRVSCELLAALLSTSPVADELVDLLPAAGRDGTLADDLLGTAAEGTMKAKTGTLRDVKALSGEMPGSDRRPIGFSLILNAPGANGARSTASACGRRHVASGRGRHADVPARVRPPPRGRAPADDLRAALPPDGHRPPR